MIVFLLQGCSKNNESIASGEVSIKIKSVSSVFANAGIGVGKNASVGKSSVDIYNSGIQRNTVSLNSDFILVSELVPDAVSSANVKNSIIKKTASSVTTVVENNVKYKLLVYDASGTLTEERDYVVGPESVNNPELKLSKGASYTFIAVSFNSNILPDISNKTNLSTATVELSTSPTPDLMHYTYTTTLSADDESNLAINFTHAFSKITVEIDASDTEYNISAVNSMFNSAYLTNSLKLSTMILTKSGAASSAVVNFNTVNRQIITSSPIMVSAQGGATNSYRISSLTINTIVGNNINVFENMTIQPGVSYTLKMKVAPEDAFIDNNRVRINGQVWMRFNLGAPGMAAGTSPDLNPDNGSLWGALYRWGDPEPTIEVIPSGDNVIMASTGYNGYNFNSQFDVQSNYTNGKSAWDPYDEFGNPVKGSTDPCPEGFRVPLIADFEKLISSVDPSWGSSFDQFKAVEILRSKRKFSVKMTIPLQGTYTQVQTDNVTLTFAGVGSWNLIQTRNYPANPSNYGVIFYFTRGPWNHLAVYNTPNVANVVRPYVVRCVGI